MPGADFGPRLTRVSKPSSKRDRADHQTNNRPAISPGGSDTWRLPMATKRKYRKRNMSLNELVEWAYMQTKLGGPDGECWEWMRSMNTAGYPQISFKGKIVQLTRLIMIHREGEHPDLYVCHDCDNPKCINPDHLRWDSASNNNIDHAKRGKRGPKLKLTINQVRYIRQLLRFGFKQREIAEWYHVTIGTISQINTGKQWAHVT